MKLIVLSPRSHGRNEVVEVVRYFTRPRFSGFHRERWAEVLVKDFKYPYTAPLRELVVWDD